MGMSGSLRKVPIRWMNGVVTRSEDQRVPSQTLEKPAPNSESRLPWTPQLIPQMPTAARAR